MKYPNYAKSVTVAGEQPPSPVGWDQRIYQAQPGTFQFSKKSLCFSNDLFIEEIDLSAGSIRVDGVITDGRLQIGVYESENYRLLGVDGSTTISTLSYSGSLWDAVAAAPSKGVTFNAGPELAQKIIDKETSIKLIENMTKKDVFGSLLLRVTENIFQLSKTMKQVFRLVKSLDFEKIDELQFKWIEEDLIGCAQTVVDELSEKIIIQPSRRRNAYAIAHKIEDLLWTQPFNNDCDMDLEYFTKYFDCSRRQIQLAIEENFGMGFVALKRLIRLHQLNEKLLSADRKRSIAELALEHNFDHLGRFSGYYKEMFEVTAIKARQNSHKRSE